jgi:crossover junction endodeoxyribonuclease RuvC
VKRPAKIILGIDPGTLMMGYGIIEVNGNRVMLKEMNVLKLSSKKPNPERLHSIHEKVTELIKKFRPHEFAIEAPFFGKNVQSMLKLGRAQGVAIAAAMSAGIPVTEYSPKKIKQSITGNGNADKEQVWRMLQRMLSIRQETRLYDATDALAVAVCHSFQTRSKIAGTKNFKSWDDFIRKNPGKVKS